MVVGSNYLQLTALKGKQLQLVSSSFMNEYNLVVYGILNSITIIYNSTARLK